MRSRPRFLAALLLGAVTGCQSQPPDVSRWTPSDFAVDVQEMGIDGDGLPRVARRFQVWAGGLAIYRESDRDVAGPDGVVPLFERVCAYDLHPNSVRMLGRLLERSGLFEAAAAGAEVRALIAGDVTIRWSAFRDSGAVGSWTEDPVVFDRLLHVVNAFVPDGRTFGSPSGEREPRHAADVPQPVSSLRNAIEAHELLVEMRPEDDDLLRELRALQAVAGIVPHSASF